MYLHRLQHFGHVQIADIRIAADSDPRPDRSTIRSGLQTRRRLEDGRPREKLQLENRCNHEEIEWLCILARWSGVFVLLPSRMSPSPCLPMSAYHCPPTLYAITLLCGVRRYEKCTNCFEANICFGLAALGGLGIRAMGLTNDKTFPGFNVQIPRCKSSCRKNGYCLYRTKELNTAVIWHLRRCICLMDSPALQLFNFYLFRASTKCAVRSRDTHRLPEPFVA